jgi:allantoin racemase
VAEAVKLAEAIVGLGLTTSKAGPYAMPRVKRYTGACARFAPARAGGG